MVSKIRIPQMGLRPGGHLSNHWAPIVVVGWLAVPR